MHQLRDRGRRSVPTWLAHERARLDAVRQRPSLADPRGHVTAAPARGRRPRGPRPAAWWATGSTAPPTTLDATRARVRALSPLETLRRGYAVLQAADGAVVTASVRWRARGSGSARASSTAASTSTLAATRPAPTPRPRGDTVSDPSADELGYEQAREELVEVVQRARAGRPHASRRRCALWERGEQLAQVCQAWLDGARRRLDEVLASEPTATEPTRRQARLSRASST